MTSSSVSPFLLDLIRARKGLRRLLSGLSAVLALASLGGLVYPMATDVLQHRIQQRLAAGLRTPEAAAAYRAGTVGVGRGLTRLRIPDAGADVIVVEGTGRSALRAGAGHYPGTPLPGQPGNVAIAGHRTTYGKPFANLDRLRVGSVIELDTPVGPYTYRVVRDPYPVARTDLSVVDWSPGSTLTLTTCHPKGSARQRLVVRAELVPPGRV
jgi:sortase A